MEKVLFLDIDGVLQPCSSQKRFDHTENNDIEKAYNKLTKKFGVDYRRYNKYDVAAVYYDWDNSALSELRRVLKTTGAKIVISSNWKSEGLPRLVDFFRIYSLNEFIMGITPDVDTDPVVTDFCREHVVHNSRSAEIMVYLRAHPEIKEYAAVDDMDLGSDLIGHAVWIEHGKLTRLDSSKCIAILGIKNE